MNPRRRQWLLQLAAWTGCGQAHALAQGSAAASASAAASQPPNGPAQHLTGLPPPAHASPAQRAATGPAEAASPATATAAAPADPVRRGRAIRFPRDHGAHLGQRAEWWYATGWLTATGEAPPDTRARPRAAAGGAAPAPAGAGTGAGTGTGTVKPTGLYGFQLTFFRSRTGLASSLPGRFAPRQLLFAHVAITDLDGARHLHDQRLVRWSEAPDAATGAAALTDGRVHIGDWSFRREGPLAASRWIARLPAGDFGIDLALAVTQPPILQGDEGFSRKGPQEQQASHYYSLPQMQASGSLTLDRQPRPLAGRAWLDHEWSDEILHPQAVGWDWIGMNLADGSALTAFVLRRADGSAIWAGGSYRAAGGASRSFGPSEVIWKPGRQWRSPATAARYPVEWTLDTPVGTFSVRALADAQELDSRGSTGSIYWEGLSELLNGAGSRVGLGYLEMTGYAGALRMG